MKITAAETAFFLRGPLKDFKAGPRAPRPYIGDEFCERRLPSDGFLAGLRGAGALKGGRFTLVTPPLTERGLARAKTVITRLASGGDGFEVVMNDWGLLKFLSGFGGGIEIVLGRILTSRHARSMIFDEFNAYFMDFALQNRIRRMEFNLAGHLLAAQGQLTRKGVKAHLYTPYSFMTWSRFCLCAVKFRGDPAASRSRCSMDCQRYYAAVSPAKKGVPLPITIRGNAYFTEQDAPEGLSGLRVDRLVKDGLF